MKLIARFGFPFNESSIQYLQAMLDRGMLTLRPDMYPNFGAGFGGGGAGASTDGEQTFEATGSDVPLSTSSSNPFGGTKRRKRQVDPNDLPSDGDFLGIDELLGNGMQGIDDLPDMPFRYVPGFDELPLPYVKAMEVLFSSLDQLQTDVEGIKKPNGTKDNPARTCKDLLMCHPKTQDGQ